jgi:muramidase (phage lysozyme)
MDFGVSAHYLLALAELRTGITDGGHPNQCEGPFSLSDDELRIFSVPPYFDPAIEPDGVHDWVAQSAIFGAMVLQFETKVREILGGQPNARELYLAQLIGTGSFEEARADLQASMAGLLEKISRTGEMTQAVKNEGISPETINARAGALLGNGTIADALASIGTKLDPIFAATTGLINDAAKDTVAITNSSTPLAPITQAPKSAPAANAATPNPSPKIADQGMSPEQKAVLDAVSSREGADYNTIAGAGRGNMGAPATFSDYSHHPDIPAFRHPNGTVSTGAGRYQFEFTTWQHYGKNLPDFSPASQDKAAWLDAADHYHRRTGRDLLTDLKAKRPGTLEALQSSLRSEWAAAKFGVIPQVYEASLKRYQA